ncbi:ATP-binding protein [Roseivirga sp. BDSF3-8]|uniref:hybrid sensor histidine kinase/response regulator n=1 Tax=Roseivirga sp. BDSF3-8 TaxID=3241598 RepID=UPI003531DDA3
MESLLREISRAGEQTEWPDYHSREGFLLRVAALVVFIDPENAVKWIEALKKCFTAPKYEALMGLIACARFIHFWVTIHPDIEYDDDMHLLLDRFPNLKEVIENRKMEKERVLLDSALHAELSDLRHMANLSMALINSEGRFRAAIKAVDGILWTNSPSGEMVGEQPGWQSLTHQSYDDYQGYGWSRAVHPDDAQPTINAWNEAIKEQKTFVFQHRVKRHDGEWRRFSIRAIPVKDENGEIREWVGVHTDITEQFEQAESLRKAKAEAEAANQFKSEFLANMTHELRTPMNAIVGITELLARDDSLAERQRRIVDTLKLSAGSMMELINDILDMARIESNRMELEKITFSPARVIKNVINILEINARDKSLGINSNTSQFIDYQFIGDPQRFKQIITNLISNAIKFTHEGEVTISMDVLPSPHLEGLSEASSENKTSLLRIKVKDTGIGIDPDKQEIIFNKFTQADSSITRKYGGSGLGLTISRNLALAMKGDLTVTSEPGKGSEFCLQLPLKIDKSYEAAGIEKGHMNKSNSSLADANAKPKVLLVEDYEPNVLVAGHMLEILGYDFDVATNGFEALDIIKNKHSDYLAILMDIQMPGMDGMETTRHIRRYEYDESLRPIPIIAVTAHASREDMRKCLKAGMDQYISKPYTFEDISNVLDGLREDNRKRLA